MSDLWQTPPGLLAALSAAGAKLSFDPCPGEDPYVDEVDSVNEDGSFAYFGWRVTQHSLYCLVDIDQVTKYCTFRPDGLKGDWPTDGHAWVNPPYSGDNKAKWINKCIEQANRGVTSWLILPAKPQEKWFRQAMAAGGAKQAWFIGKRVRFIDPATGLEGTKPGNGSVVFQFGPKLIKIDSVIESEWGGFIVKDWIV